MWHVHILLFHTLWWDGFFKLIGRDSYRILGLGGETQHLGGSGGHVPPGKVFENNALRLILGHFLVHMHILDKCKSCQIHIFCCNYAKKFQY